MKNLLRFVFVFICCHSLSAQNFDNLSFGTADTFEVITWNIENFPKNGQQTLDDVTRIIEVLDVDIIAIQEINDEIVFNQLVSGLASYNGFMESTISNYDGLAYLYKPTEVQINSIYRIYETSQYWNAFPRAPMIMDLMYHNQRVIIINNHLKCCGDGTLVLNNTSDEEYRRYEANDLLKSYIDNHFANLNVIVLGDMNDELTDVTSNNVFQQFIDDASNYTYADFQIAQGPSTDWSYPSWPSHLDHILITNELFDEFQLNTSQIEVIKVEESYPGGFFDYDAAVSDHRPVALKLVIDSNLGVEDDVNKKTLATYPNPVKDQAVFNFKPAAFNSKFEIINLMGQVVYSEKINQGQTSATWIPKTSMNGIYVARLFSNNTILTTKFVLSK